MKPIQMITLEELWKNLADREQNKEIVKIHLKGEEDYVNSYYCVHGDGADIFDFYIGDQIATIKLQAVTTAFVIEAPKRNCDGASVLIWIDGKDILLWNKERKQYFYKILEIKTETTGNSILKLEDLYNEGREFHMRIPKNWEVINDYLGLLKKG